MMDPLKLMPIANTRYSITLQWAEFKVPTASYRLQIWDRTSGWTTKYWGHKTHAEVEGLGPEECYHFRVGVTTHDESQSSVWSRIVPANTKDDFILVANLHRASKYGNVNAVRKFINSRPGALDCLDQLGRPPLASAAEPQVTALLLISGASNDLPARFTERTPLMHAASRGLLEVATLLVERGASWDTRDSDVGVLRLLVNAGANTRAADSRGLTALHLAVLGHRAEAVALLLEGAAPAGVDPAALFAVAAANGDSDIESLLKQHFNIDNNSRKEGRSTPALSIPTA